MGLGGLWWCVCGGCGGGGVTVWGSWLPVALWWGVAMSGFDRSRFVFWCRAWFGGAVKSCAQVMMTIEWSRARAVLNCSRHGHLVGRWRVLRRALRVTCAGSRRWCRRRVSVVMMVSCRPRRLVQRARLWAMTLRPEPGGVGAESCGWHVVQSDTVFQVADDVFDDGVAAMVGFELERFADPVGDHCMVGVVGEQGEL